LNACSAVNNLYMYDRAQKLFLSREDLTHRLDLSAAACGCRADSAIRQVPVVAVHHSASADISAKSLKQVIRFSSCARCAAFHLISIAACRYQPKSSGIQHCRRRVYQSV
jgi:hypothetical protein